MDGLVPQSAYVHYHDGSTDEFRVLFSPQGRASMLVDAAFYANGSILIRQTVTCSGLPDDTQFVFVGADYSTTSANHAYFVANDYVAIVLMTSATYRCQVQGACALSRAVCVALRYVIFNVSCIFRLSVLF